MIFIFVEVDIHEYSICSEFTKVCLFFTMMGRKVYFITMEIYSLEYKLIFHNFVIQLKNKIL